MLALIDDILDNAKLDKNSFRLLEEPFTISSLFEEVSKIFEI